MATKRTAMNVCLSLLLTLGAAGPVISQEYMDALSEAQKSGEYAKALRLIEPQAKQGVPEAQYSLGRMYALGQGVEKNMVEAVKWYRKAAEQGMPEAQYQLGEAYGSGDGVPQDYVLAYQWMSRAAQGGDPRARAAMRSYAELMPDEQLRRARQAAGKPSQQ